MIQTPRMASVCGNLDFFSNLGFVDITLEGDMNVKKISDQQSISHSNSALATTSSKDTSSKDTPSIAKSSSAKNVNGHSGAVEEVSSWSKEEVDEMFANYQREAAKDKFVIPPPSPLVLDIIRRDPLAVWKALQKM